MELGERLTRLDFVRRADARPVTGSVIVVYDAAQVNGTRVADRLLAEIAPGAAPASGSDPDPAGRDRGKPGSGRPGRSRPARGRPAMLAHLANATFLTGFLSYAVVRRLVFRSPLSQRALSATGIVATIGAVPLLYRAIDDLRQGKRFGLFPFLAASCGLAIGLGEALTALEIIWVLAVGLLLETHASDRARRAIRQIVPSASGRVVVLEDGAERERPLSEVRAGDTVVVRSGAKLPADGVVVAGEALMDESAINGRSEPALRGPKDTVYAGTGLQQGELRVRVDRLGRDTYLSRVLRMVEESLENPSDAEVRADELARRLMGMGGVATVLTLFLTQSFQRSFSVLLVMSCPCATVLAASTAIAAGVANAARNHILIKGGRHLEAAEGVRCFCFDKTGTVTTDVPEVVEVIGRAPRQDPDRILALAARAEAGDAHPLARALVRAARARGVLEDGEVASEVFLGRGVRTRVDGRTLHVGSRAFLESEGVATAYFDRKARAFAERGRTVLYVARDGKLQGMIALAQAARGGAKSTLDRLRAQGVARLVLISGDAEPAVRAVAEDLGFDAWEAEILPEAKARYVEGLEMGGGPVAMVGDGVNDALALSRASLGVAMGAGGSEAAIVAADVALVRSELEDLLVLRRLSERTLRTIEQNFWVANATNLVGLLLGMSGWLSPMMAGLIHVGHTLGIMLNSSRLIGWNPRRPSSPGAKGASAPWERVLADPEYSRQPYRPAVRRALPQDA